jgi:ethanolamine utilization protein EutN
MFLGRVVGRLWATRQAAGLAGRKLLLVRPETAAGQEADRLVVAVDGLAAGPGDRVVVAHGSRVRDLTVGADVADKDIVLGIVDGHDRVDERGGSPREPVAGGGEPSQGSTRKGSAP